MGLQECRQFTGRVYSQQAAEFPQMHAGVHLVKLSPAAGFKSAVVMLCQEDRGPNVA